MTAILFAPQEFNKRKLQYSKESISNFVKPTLSQGSLQGETTTKVYTMNIGKEFPFDVAVTTEFTKSNRTLHKHKVLSSFVDTEFDYHYLSEYKSENERLSKPVAYYNGNVLEEKKKTDNLITINSFLNLEYNWNDNEAQPFSESLINEAKQIIMGLFRQPDVFPTARNSIQFEYERDNGDYFEIELFSGRLEIFSIINNEESELSLSYDSQNILVKELNKKIEEFHDRRS